MAHPAWSDLELYVIQEHIEDFNDGRIGRRELLRKVTLVTGSLAVTLAVLPTLGCAPAGTTAAPSASAAPTAAGAPPSASAAASVAAPAVPYATPPAARTTDGVTVAPSDPRISAQPVQPKGGGDGAPLIGYFAAPKAAGRYPGVLVIHENRGLTEHIRDVVRRFATAGFAAVSIDLLSRQGGADRLGDSYASTIARTSPDALVSDLKAALGFLVAQPSVRGDALVATGYCMGGGLLWSLLGAGADLRAAAPYYGPAPSNLGALASTKAAVLGVYAANDNFVTPSKDRIEAELKKAGAPYQIVVYAGAGHAFHNDTGGNYNPDVARTAWVATIDWFKKYAG